MLSAAPVSMIDPFQNCTRFVSCFSITWQIAEARTLATQSERAVEAYDRISAVYNSHTKLSSAPLRHSYCLTRAVAFVLCRVVLKRIIEATYCLYAATFCKHHLRPHMGSCCTPPPLLFYIHASWLHSLSPTASAGLRQRNACQHQLSALELLEKTCCFKLSYFGQHFQADIGYECCISIRHGRV